MTAAIESGAVDHPHSIQQTWTIILTKWPQSPWIMVKARRINMSAPTIGGIAVLLAFCCLLAATRSALMSGLALLAIVSTLVLVIGRLSRWQC